MRNNNITTLDGCLIPALASLIGICFLLALMGCTHTEYVPKIEYQDVFYPQPCIIHMDIPDMPILHEYPSFDDGFSPDDAKRWSLEVERIEKSNNAKQEAYIRSLLFLVEEHNRLEPQCKQ